MEEDASLQTMSFKSSCVPSGLELGLEIGDPFLLGFSALALVFCLFCVHRWVWGLPVSGAGKETPGNFQAMAGIFLRDIYR